MAAIQGRWADHPTVDFALSILLFALLAWANVAHVVGLDAYTLSERAGIYTSASIVLTLLTGLGSVAISAHTSGSGPRARLLRESFGRELRANWRQVVTATALAAVLAWSAQLIDPTYGTRWAASVVCTAIGLALLTITRQLYLFLALMRINDRDQAEAQAPPPSRVTYAPRNPRKPHPTKQSTERPLTL